MVVGSQYEKPKEKTIDLYGRYDENDLIVEEVVEEPEMLQAQIEAIINDNITAPFFEDEEEDDECGCGVCGVCQIH